MTSSISKQQTIQERLDQIRDDLIELAFCCNRDHQYREASKLQDILVVLKEVNVQCAEVATWPPKVNIGNDGEPHWECAE